MAGREAGPTPDQERKSSELGRKAAYFIGYHSPSTMDRSVLTQMFVAPADEKAGSSRTPRTIYEQTSGGLARRTTIMSASDCVDVTLELNDAGSKARPPRAIIDARYSGVDWKWRLTRATFYEDGRNPVPTSYGEAALKEAIEVFKPTPPSDKSS